MPEKLDEKKEPGLWPRAMRTRAIRHAYGVSRDQLRAWHKKGFVRAAKFGPAQSATIVYSTMDLERLLEDLSAGRAPAVVVRPATRPATGRRRRKGPFWAATTGRITS